MSSRVQFRHKVVVVPYIFCPISGQKMYVMIQDKESEDWSFVTGGKKNIESYYEAAMRELSEETKDVIVPGDLCEVCTLTTSFRPKKHKAMDQGPVKTVYKIFETLVPFQADLRSRFHSVPRTQEDETRDIRYISRTDILYNKHDRIWNFIRKEIAPVYFS